MKVILIICTPDHTLLAEVHGDYELGRDRPPASAYHMRGGVERESAEHPGLKELRCPNHTGKFRPIYQEVQV